MQIEQTTRDGCTILTLWGKLEFAAVPRLRHVLLKQVAERPIAVICDLSGVSAIDQASATVFTTVASHPATGWPATGLALCGAQATVANAFDRLRVPGFLPMHPTLEDALTSATACAPSLREELVLASSPTAPAAARRFVREVCCWWRLEKIDRPDAAREASADDLVDRAVLVADELVTNAVVHAGAGDLRLRIEWDGGRLQLAVHDAIPRLLRSTASPGPESERGRGLLLVDELATAWGVHARSEGKVVWCVLDR
jgi:anti-anti-sigma regulatory factor